MCRLFALISKIDHGAEYWFFKSNPTFLDFSKKEIARGPHDSGWGVAWLKNESWDIFKEGKNDVSKYSFNKLDGLKSKKIIAHLRWASQGEEIYRNTHPFAYKDFVFIHNGLIDRVNLLDCLNSTFKSKIETDTDSEVFFFLIMQYYEQSKNIIKSIESVVKLVKKYSHTGLNFILSDKDNTYIFRDAGEECKELWSYYSLYYLIQKEKIVICSDKLSRDDWVLLNLGELLVVDCNLNIKQIVIDN